MKRCLTIAVGLICWATAAFADDTVPEKLIAAGHWKRAMSMVEAHIREAPDDPLANFLLSQVRGAFGDRRSPLPLAEKAVALDGRTAKYHRQVAEVLGVVAQHSGVVQQLFLARRFYREVQAALALDGQDLQAWRDLMEFYLLAPGVAGGDRSKANEVAERIQAIDPAEGLLARARIASFQKQTVEAARLLRNAVNSAPGNYRARIELAKFYATSERPDPRAAEEQAQQAVQLCPGRVEGYVLLATIYADRADWTSLDEILAAAAAQVPDDLAPCYRAAERLLTSGRDLPRAERYLRAYLAQPPEGNEPPTAEAHSKLALVLEKESRKRQAN